MTLKFSLAAAALAGTIVFAVTPGTASELGGIGALKQSANSATSPIEKAAFWRGKCHWGPGGYHKWVPGVGRVQCTSHKCWTNSWGIRRCRWF